MSHKLHLLASLLLGGQKSVGLQHQGAARWASGGPARGHPPKPPCPQASDSLPRQVLLPGLTLSVQQTPAEPQLTTLVLSLVTEQRCLVHRGALPGAHGGGLSAANCFTMGMGIFRNIKQRRTAFPKSLPIRLYKILRAANNNHYQTWKVVNTRHVTFVCT